MREPYTPPQLTVVGSVNELTQGLNLTLRADTVFGITIPVGGPNPPTSR